MIARPSPAAMLGTLLLGCALMLPKASSGRDPFAAMGLCSTAPILASAQSNDAAPPAAPAARVTQLSCEAMQDVPGKFLVTAEVAFPPHARSGAHRHPGSVTAYVLRGTVRSQMAGGPALVYQPGQTWFEPAGMVHLLAENTGDTPALLLATFVVDGGCGPLVLPA